MGQANIIFLGPARDWTRVPIAQLPFEDRLTIAELKRCLQERFPDLSSRFEHVRFAINDEFASDHDVVQDGDDVAVIPPVSGG